MKTQSRRSDDERERLVRLIQLQCKQGATVPEACYEQGISVSSYHAWRDKYGFPLITVVRGKAKARETKTSNEPEVVVSGNGSSHALEVAPEVVPNREPDQDPSEKLVALQEQFTRSGVAKKRRQQREKFL